MTLFSTLFSILRSSRVLMLALLAPFVVILAACQPGASTKPQVSNPPQQTISPNGQYTTPGSNPQLARRPQPMPTPPSLPSLEDLIGRLPHATTQPNATTQMIEPPIMPMTRGTRVAILLPLSGANQRVGASMLNAAQMALFEFAGYDFEILVHDTQGTPEGAQDAARIAIADGAKLIIGPLLSTSVRAISDSARAANVPVVAFSSDRSVAGNGVYTMGFFPGEEIKRVVHYAVQQGKTRFALMAPRGAYGDAVARALNAATRSVGGQVVQTEFYDPLKTEFSDPVKRIAHYDQRRGALLHQRRQLTSKGDEVSKRALARLSNLETLGDVPYDALLLADGGKRLIAVAAMLPFYDVDPKKVKILGTGQWDEPGLGAEPALIDGWFAAPDPNVRQRFSDKYVRAYGNRPHRLATLAYDATALAVVLSQQMGADPYRSHYLTQVGGFAGRDGLFRFTAQGAVERGLAVMRVGPKTAEVIDDAPSSFPEPPPQYATEQFPNDAMGSNPYVSPSTAPSPSGTNPPNTANDEPIIE